MVDAVAAAQEVATVAANAAETAVQEQRDSAVSEAIEAAHEAEERAEELAEDIAAAAMENERGQRIAALEERANKWPEEIQAAVRPISDRLSQMETVIQEMTERLSSLTPAAVTVVAAPATAEPSIPIASPEQPAATVIAVTPASENAVGQPVPGIVPPRKRVRFL